MADAEERILASIESHAAEFDSVETISVRPAAEMVRGEPDWGKPYVRVVARRPDLLRSQIPTWIDRIPVRVVAATMEEQAERFLAFRRAPQVTPAMAASEWRTGFLSSETEAPKNYSRLTYQPLNPSRLVAAAGPVKMTLHVGPDHGWPVLREFLSPAGQWQIAMFDFTARHIYDRLCSAIDSRATLSLCLGPNESGGEGSRPTGISEPDIVDGLRARLGNRFHFAWASIGIERQFPTAYHIKLAVRDRAAFWLSSGNWQSTNQPARDYSTGGRPLPAEIREMAKGNREWHVIVEDPALAEIFSDYIEKDLTASAMDGTEEAPAPIAEPPFPDDNEFVMEFRAPFSPLLAEEEAPRLPQQVFAPLVLAAADPVRVQPILTPDNYAEHVLALIRGAQRRLWFQNQSLAISRSVSPGYRELLDALKKQCWAIDDSRIIIRDLIRPQTLDVLRMLEREGFPMHKVRVMKTCHTKGILVDSRRTLVGSHNWTNEGTLYNRDASLLIDDPRVTAYFEAVLDHDWNWLAEQVDVDPGRPSAILPLPGESIPGESIVLDPRLNRAAD